MCLAGTQAAPVLSGSLHVPALPQRDMTAGKIRYPHELTSLLFPSGLGGKSIIDQEQGGGVVWHVGV